MFRTLLRNVISNSAAFLVHVTVALFLTPFVLHSLGPVRYGIWSLATGVVGYYGFLDIGFRAGMTQYMSRHLALGDYTRANRVASTAFLGLTACGAVVFLVTVIVAALTPHLFKLPDDGIRETQLCVLILGLSASTQFLFFTFASVFPATQRFDVSNAVVIIIRIASAVGTYCVLMAGCGLIGLSLLTAISDLILYVVLWRLSYRVLPQLSVSPSLANGEEFWPIIRFGFWSFFINGAGRIKSRIDILIVALCMPIAAVAPYTLALSMVEYLENVFTPIGYVFFPAVTQLDAQGQRDRLKSVYLVGTRLLMLLAIAAGLLSATWASSFFNLWVGASVTSNGTYPSPATLYYYLVVGAVFTASQRIGLQVCMGTRRIRPLAAIVASEAIVKVLMSLTLIYPLGLIGVAIGAFLPAFLFELLVLPFFICNFLGISIRDYVVTTCFRPAVVTCLLAVCLLPILLAFPALSTWPKLLFYASGSAVAATAIITLFGLSAADREQYLWRSLRNIWKRGAPSGSQSKDLNSTATTLEGAELGE